MRRPFVVIVYFHGFRGVFRSSPGLSRKDAGLMSAKYVRNGSGASSGSAAPSPLYPTPTVATNGDAGATGAKPSPLVEDAHAGIPLGLSKLDREDLEVGKSC